MTFQDHFSAHADDYARFRPAYPPELFRWLAGLVPRADTVWDCATGNGQAALGLAACFRRVVASDASAEQIAQAPPHPGVEYHVWPAEQAGLDTGVVDLVTVAQALHWFDLERFYAEVRRVLRPAGVLACWGYGFQGMEPAFTPALTRYYHEIVGPYWPGERSYIDSHYQKIPFPFAELAPPASVMEQSMTLAELLGYLGTWSATRRYLAARGQNPLELIHEELRALWGPPELRRPVRWDLFFRVGRV